MRNGLDRLSYWIWCNNFSFVPQFLKKSKSKTPLRRFNIVYFDIFHHWVTWGSCLQNNFKKFCQRRCSFCCGWQYCRTLLYDVSQWSAHGSCSWGSLLLPNFFFQLRSVVKCIIQMAFIVELWKWVTTFKTTSTAWFFFIFVEFNQDGKNRRWHINL